MLMSILVKYHKILELFLSPVDQVAMDMGLFLLLSALGRLRQRPGKALHPFEESEKSSALNVNTWHIKGYPS